MKLVIFKCDICGKEISIPHKWTFYFMMAVGFWNFVGAGIFGFLINLPVVSYYEIGTNLTANHGHTAMMGVYGMLAMGFLVFVARYFIPPDKSSERAMAISFWSLNIGLAWMVFLTLFPVGLLQLYEAVNHGYFEARSLKFLTGSVNTALQWLRLPGDLIFIIGGLTDTQLIVFPTAILFILFSGFAAALDEQQMGMSTLQKSEDKARG